MNLRFLAIIAAVIIGLFGVLVLTNKKTDAPTNNSSATTGGTNNVQGAGNKNVTLVEFGDLQCPACKSYYPIVKQLHDDYGDQVKIQFRNFPLVQIHQYAMIAARAAQAAADQGKFWEMHDMMYENQDTWSQSDPTATFEAYASQLGLNVAQFKTDMASAATLSIINTDVKAAQSFGANSTPTFVLNGKKIDQNPQSLDAFKKLIDDAIAQKNPS
jgi:protein-disulfide isomerase